MSKDNKAREAVNDTVTAEIYTIPLPLLQAAINTLAELPYKTVGSLVNNLRACKPLDLEISTIPDELLDDE